MLTSLWMRDDTRCGDAEVARAGGEEDRRLLERLARVALDLIGGLRRLIRWITSGTRPSVEAGSLPAEKAQLCAGPCRELTPSSHPP